MKGIHRWPVDSPHKGSVTRNVSIRWRHHDKLKTRAICIVLFSGSTFFLLPQMLICTAIGLCSFTQEPYDNFNILYQLMHHMHHYNIAHIWFHAATPSTTSMIVIYQVKTCNKTSSDFHKIHIMSYWDFPHVLICLPCLVGHDRRLLSGDRWTLIWWICQHGVERTLTNHIMRYDYALASTILPGLVCRVVTNASYWMCYNIDG